MQEIEAIFLGMGLEIETSVLEEEREFSLKNIYNDQFKGKNILEILKSFREFRDFKHTK